MKILVISWRDIKSPFAGGAEVYTYEICKRLAAKGHDITLLAPRFKNSERFEILDGIKIIRYAGKYSLYFKAGNYFRKYLSNEKFDIVIDQINTIPFFTFSFADKTKIVTIIYQLAGEFWFQEVRFPFNLFGYYFFEKACLKRYSKFPSITISNSTRHDLEKLNFKNINIVPIGINAPIVLDKQSLIKKETIKLAYLGRLAKTKKIFDILTAFEIINEQYPDTELSIMGNGYLKERLLKYSKTLKCYSKIIFHGFLNEDEKFKILKESKILLVSGIREGWGIVVTEANSVGVPAVGYNIPGLRDSIIDGKTGILCEPNPKSMAEEVIRLISDRNLLDILSNNALENSYNFSWDKSADKLEEVLVDVCSKKCLFRE